MVNRRIVTQLYFAISTVTCTSATSGPECNQPPVLGAASNTSPDSSDVKTEDKTLNGENVPYSFVNPLYDPDFDIDDKSNNLNNQTVVEGDVSFNRITSKLNEIISAAGNNSEEANISMVTNLNRIIEEFSKVHSQWKDIKLSDLTSVDFGEKLKTTLDSLPSDTKSYVEGIESHIKSVQNMIGDVEAFKNEKMKPLEELNSAKIELTNTFDVYKTMAETLNENFEELNAAKKELEKVGSELKTQKEAVKTDNSKIKSVTVSTDVEVQPKEIDQTLNEKQEAFETALKSVFDKTSKCKNTTANLCNIMKELECRKIDLIVKDKKVRQTDLADKIEDLETEKRELNKKITSLKNDSQNIENSYGSSNVDGGDKAGDKAYNIQVANAKNLESSKRFYKIATIGLSGLVFALGFLLLNKK